MLCGKEPCDEENHLVCGKMRDPRYEGEGCEATQNPRFALAHHSRERTNP